jgi:hypothetical protein
LLFQEAPSADGTSERDADRSYAPDLSLDQIVAAVAGDREERGVDGRVAAAGGPAARSRPCAAALDASLAMLALCWPG